MIRGENKEAVGLGRWNGTAPPIQRTAGPVRQYCETRCGRLPLRPSWHEMEGRGGQGQRGACRNATETRLLKLSRPGTMVIGGWSDEPFSLRGNPKPGGVSHRVFSRERWIAPAASARSLAGSRRKPDRAVCATLREDRHRNRPKPHRGFGERPLGRE